VRTIRLADPDGRPIPGLPIIGSDLALLEPAFDLDGAPLGPDPAGIDPEGLAALSDGGFWVSEEYGPSLLRLGPDGRVRLRLVPEGVSLPGAPYPVEAWLPAIAARRQLNRGFEAVAVSPSEARMFVAFQSPLAHPDAAAFAAARHVRIWQMDAHGQFEAQYLYRLDAPKSFRRDRAKGEVKRRDLKVCEIVAQSEDRLLVLERGSETTKVYRVRLDAALRLGPEHLDAATRPTIEEMSGAGETLPELRKTRLFTSDDHPEWRRTWRAWRSSTNAAC
jgi:hypothetical protein